LVALSIGTARSAEQMVEMSLPQADGVAVTTQADIGAPSFLRLNLASLLVRGEKSEIVIPSLSIKAEPPVALVDEVVDAKGTRKVAEAYLTFLYAPQAQKLIAHNYYRPSDPTSAAPNDLARFPVTSSSCRSTIRFSGDGPRRNRSTLRMAASSTRSINLSRPIRGNPFGLGVKIMRSEKPNHPARRRGRFLPS
jgi:hypothetical protein